MFDLLQQLLSGTDWNAKARALFDYVDTTHPAFVAAVVGVLIFVGSKVVALSPGLRKTGLRLGLVTFLLFLGFEWYRADNFGKDNLPTAVLKSFNAGGFVLAVTWIVLPVVSFVYAHLRVALAAVLGSVGYSFLCTNDEPAEMGVRAGIVVAVTLTIAWIVHPIWDYIRDMLPRPKPRPDRGDDADDTSVRRRHKHRPRREAEEPRPVNPPLVESPAPVIASPAVPAPVVPPLLPMPAGQAPIDVVSTQLEVVSAPPSEDQRRRDRIRLQVEMAYVMATPHLGTRLPRDAFNELLHRYPSATHLPLDDVEENSRQLLIILQEHQKQAQAAPPQALTSVAVLTPGAAPAAVPSPASAVVEELLRRLLEERRGGPEAGSPRLHADHAPGNHHAPPADVAPNGSSLL